MYINNYIEPDVKEPRITTDVNKEPTISGCPKQFPKSEAPLDAFIKISTGVWYFQSLCGTKNYREKRCSFKFDCNLWKCDLPFSQPSH